MASGKRLVVKIGFTLLIIAIVGVIGLVLYVKEQTQPMPASEQTVRIVIPSGSGSAQIAKLLEQKGIIRDAQMFSYYLKYKEQGSKFQAGEYEMTPGIKVDAIIDMLNSGLVVKEQGIKLTVPEGYTVRQIADKASQQFGTDPALFIKTAQEYTGFTAKVFQQIPNDSKLRNKLEGYLFPETFEWKKDIKPEEMIDNMMLELDKKLAMLPDDWQQTMAAHGQNFHQMMTIASLIEREVAVDEERLLVSGVIHNRLKKGMSLQIDATVQYMFDKPKDRLYEKDLQLESPYNTYLHPGLPPGPIASPSIASITAAIYPADTKYLFYVTKKDGSKAHLFAETYEQHQQNITASKKNNG
ncbi:endolytic transglycosylase MltG [Paenibacillus sp. LMG 31456]|uniref:Endolytic murein transglycosylase n=1 Tax=Paenibacillus foliorum TaxID=2654974 RepID=A0A972K2N1_9BACL|nr:endolytic transglycosylase MltG [Paenibacillus foliorum]NOU96085.1 endolytic transglycosylase MltG [Paenibacillus foliorum]